MINELQRILRRLRGVRVADDLDHRVADEPGDPASELVARHRDHLMAIPGVEGVAFGLPGDEPDEPALIVHVRSIVATSGVPQQIEGYPVVFKEAGKGFRAL